MLVYVTDDRSSHRAILKGTIQTVFQEKGLKDFEITECIHGADMLRKSDEKKPDLIFLDIHMPELDGLSTLVRYRAKDSSTPIIMATLETKESITRLTKQRDVTGLTEGKKMQLLSNVVERVQEGIFQEGKINSVLEAVSTLRLDPVKIAVKYGANEYVNKPYRKNDIEAVLKKCLQF